MRLVWTARDLTVQYSMYSTVYLTPRDLTTVHCSVSDTQRSDILSDITGRTPDLQCRFENRWKARLLRPGGPIVKLIVDLGPYVDGSDWPI